jgi:hypothetical protein
MDFCEKIIPFIPEDYFFRCKDVALKKFMFKTRTNLDTKWLSRTSIKKLVFQSLNQYFLYLYTQKVKITQYYKEKENTCE